MVKKIAIALTFILASCATDKSILDVQQKILAEKYISRGEHFFRFYDGTVLLVDERTWNEFKERQTVQLTYRRIVK